MAGASSKPQSEKGTLLVRYGPYAADSADALIPIEIIDERLGVMTKQLRLGAVETYQVDEGAYQVRAHLPSGEIVSRQVRVSANKKTEVNLVPRVTSPREELTWAYLLRRMDPGVPSERKEHRPTTFALTVGQRVARTSAPESSAPAVQKEDVVLMERAPSADAPWKPTAVKDAVSVETKVGPSELTLLRLAIPPAGYGAGKQWCLSIGLPWRPGMRCNTMIPPPAVDDPVRVVAHYVCPSADPDTLQLKVEVHTGSAPAEMLLGYLATGAFFAAKQVGGEVSAQAERMLYEKRQDPTAAAIAGYYLLKVGELNRLHDWTKNLANGFEWMPDSAVIRAWRLIRSGEKNESEIIRWLLEAERRGLPLFTEGLRLLFLGLDVFARREKKGNSIRDARDRLQRFADRADFRARSTTFLGQSPAQP